MTKQEAINDLKMSLRMWGRNPQKESYEIAVAALEKQMPKRFCCNKPTQVKALDSENGTVCAFTCKPCPACGKWIVDNVSHKYCEHCGQALDWGGNDE